MREVFFIGPRDISTLSEPELEGLLLQNTFPGNERKAAQFIKKIEEGREWVKRECEKLGCPFRPPSIALVESKNMDEATTDMFYDPVSNIINLEWMWLSYYSDLQDEVLKEEDEEGGLLVHAYPPDYYFLEGVEEADHARYFQAHPIENLPDPGEFPAGAAYDALPHEFDSLEARLRAARENNLPVFTRMVLEHRIAMARLFRTNAA